LHPRAFSLAAQFTLLQRLEIADSSCAFAPGLHFSPDVTDPAPQIGLHKGFSEGVEYRAYGPLKNILCEIKDQAGSVTSGKKFRLALQQDLRPLNGDSQT